MLRARKILGYVAERIEPPQPVAVPVVPVAKEEGQAEAAEVVEAPVVLKPEEYLELWCNGQVCFLSHLRSPCLAFPFPPYSISTSTCSLLKAMLTPKHS